MNSKPEKKPEKKRRLFYKSCAVCGTPFEAKTVNALYCSKECKNKAFGLRTYETRQIRGTRKCHDCGKPTDNYRCPSCWRKLRGFSENKCIHSDIEADAVSLPRFY